jgi:hypothetical protein
MMKGNERTYEASEEAAEGTLAPQSLLLEKS